MVGKMVGGLEDELGQDVLHLDQLPEPAGAGGGHHVSCARHNHFQAAMGSNAGLSGVDKILEVFLIVTFFKFKSLLLNIYLQFVCCDTFWDILRIFFICCKWRHFLDTQGFLSKK